MTRPPLPNAKAEGFPTALNPRQREVAEHGDGPLLVLAGAGTGKTSALTGRLGELVRSRRARPSEILAVTFTNKAAGIMRDRVVPSVGPDSVPRWLGTFHSLSGRMLRNHAELVGLDANFSILDAEDSRRLVVDLARELNIDTQQWTGRVLAGAIDRWKNRALVPEQVPDDEFEALADGRGRALYERYRDRLRALNAVDFGDLILHMVRVLQHNSDIADSYRTRFRHLLVDEYQDTNAAQYLWLRLLTNEDKNICCVGDDDQAIYGWRGARVDHILRFERDFPGAQVIRLEQNYRSTGHILGAGAGLIAVNAGRLSKTLWTQQETGHRVRIGGFEDGRGEAMWIADEADNFARGASGQKIPFDRIAVLVRASYLMRGIEEQLTRGGIPYRVVGGARFYERMEIRDAIAYLQLVAQPANHLAFDRVANTPRRGLGNASLAAIRKIAQEHRLPPLEAARRAIEERAIAAAGIRGLTALLDLLDGWRTDLAAGKRPAELLKQILEESGYLLMRRSEPAVESAGRAENLKEFLAALDAYEDCNSFFEHVALVQDEPEEIGEPQLSLMTIHAAKGLEFDAVFLAGWEEEVFPTPRALESGGNDAVEEERRLAHVAITRARHHLAISFAASRYSFGRMQPRSPSRFLGEIPSSHVERVDVEAVGSGFMPDRFSALERQAARAGKYRSPGWSRMQANRDRATSGKAIRRTEPAAIEFPVDIRVFHEKFGYGQVLRSDGAKILVRFDTGEKTVLSTFLTPASSSQV